MSKGRMTSETATHRVQTRREFLGTSAAVAGVAAMGVPGTAGAGERHPKRGGTLRFGMRGDSRGLDPHRNFYYYVSHPLAATSMGLMDLNAKMEPVPGLAVGSEISRDLKTYTFQLRKGATFHNGADVDAEAVKWNFERILDPKIGHVFTRSTIRDVERIEVLDKWTVRCHLKNPSAVLIPNVTYYPLQFMAPNSVDQADTHPVGCGPFKFKSWKRFEQTVLERFENWYETDAQGNALPYLDTIIGLPKKEDRVRLTALRTGEVDLIDNMAYADAGTFKQEYGDRFNAWDVPQVGTAYVSFNMKNRAFSPKNPNGKMLRQAVAHAINYEAIHQAVFNGLSAAAPGYYSESSPWHMPGLRRKYAYDPDKSRFLVRKAGAVGEPLVMISQDTFAYMQQTGEIVNAMLANIGLKPRMEIVSTTVLTDRMKKGEFDMRSGANSYRPDPDAWYSRQHHSKSHMNRRFLGFVNEDVDRLVVEAQQTLDRAKRLELYRAIEEIINDEVPRIYTHYVPLLQAGVKNLKGYAPAFAGPYSIQGAGLRSAWMA